MPPPEAPSAPPPQGGGPSGPAEPDPRRLLGGAGVDASRRRYLTILFSDLSDSTQLASQMEAEHYAAMIGALRRVAEQVVPRHGGVIVRIQGDGVLAIFGHPETREDDARRAAEAALELHARVRALGGEGWPLPPGGLTLHSGLHSGLVLLQEGDLVLGRFELLGSAANIAARLATAAGPDELLVGVETLGPQASFFQSGPPRELLLKGIAQPVTAVSVRGRASLAAGTVARAGRAQGDLVGRQAQLQLLSARLDESLQGQSRFVALCGAPGLGKTRLAEAFLQQAAAAGHAVHRGGCPAERDVAPLHPLIQMLQAALPAEGLAAQLDALRPGLAGQAAPLQRLLSPGALASARPPALGTLLPAVLAVFVAMAEQRPQVLFIDDWHWADDATRQVVGALHGLGVHRILIVVTARQLGGDDAAMSGAERVDLPPLDDDESTRAIAQLLPRADPFLAEAIRRHAGGNPLYIEELCHSAAADDLDRRLVRLHGGASWLSALIESRLARLPEAQAEVVRAAAVIGPVMPAWLLHQITGCDQGHPVWAALAEQDFVYPSEDEGRWRFKHGITRDVIYESVGVHQRRALHERIAQALEEQTRRLDQEPAHEALAYHWGAALRTDAAARHAEAAGDRAVAVSALDRAKAQYRAALTALDAQLPGKAFYDAWARVSGKLALVCVFDASRAELPLFRRAVTLAMDSGDAAAQARALYWLGYIAYAVGEPTQAVFQLELAQAAARHVRDEPLAVQVRAT
ncbi:MAG: AAA family ATPase, partial [Rubrivivax sp.]|nr:AAA family ATPase [Rubrivivax sp.]